MVGLMLGLNFFMLALLRRISFRPPSMVYISVIILQITIFFTCWTSVGSFHVLHLHLSFWLVGTRHAYTSVSMYLWISLYQPYARAPAKVVFKFEMIKSLSLAWIWTHGLRGTKLVRYQLSYPAWVAWS